MLVRAGPLPPVCIPLWLVAPRSYQLQAGSGRSHRSDLAHDAHEGHRDGASGVELRHHLRPERGGGRQSAGLSGEGGPTHDRHPAAADGPGELAALAYGQLEPVHLFPSKPYRVKTIGSMKPRKWTSVVLVDLERNGTWDERWDLTSDDVVRTNFKKPRTEDDDVSAAPSDAKLSLRQGTWQGF